MRVGAGFFAGDVLDVAPALLGKILVRKLDGAELRLRITETEAYRGEEDTACHAHRGKTPRAEVLYRAPGTLYLYLCYGVHWMLNLVTGAEGTPQATLIRAGEGVAGPGRLTKYLCLDKRYNGLSVDSLRDFWIEDDGARPAYRAAARVGIGYADEADREKLWRYTALPETGEAPPRGTKGS